MINKLKTIQKFIDSIAQDTLKEGGLGFICVVVIGRKRQSILRKLFDNLKFQSKFETEMSGPFVWINKIQ